MRKRLASASASEKATCKRLASACIHTAGDSLVLPVLPQSDVVRARRCKPLGDPDMWFLDGWLQTAFKAFSAAIDAGGSARIVVREGISCLYSRVMGQGRGGKVVSKAQLKEDRQCSSDIKVGNEIKALASIGIHMDRLARHVIEASTLAFRPEQLVEYISFIPR